jgi:hypothetical protein
MDAEAIEMHIAKSQQMAKASPGCIHRLSDSHSFCPDDGSPVAVKEGAAVDPLESRAKHKISQECDCCPEMLEAT